MFEVINAEEAFEISVQSKNDLETDLIDITLQKIDDLIRSAAEKGETEIQFSWHNISDQVHYFSHDDKVTDESYTRAVRYAIRHALENKGYNIIFNGVGSVSVIVRWGGIGA